MCGGKIDDSHRDLWLTFCFSAVKKLTEIGGLVISRDSGYAEGVKQMSFASWQ